MKEKLIATIVKTKLKTGKCAPKCCVVVGPAK